MQYTIYRSGKPATEREVLVHNDTLRLQWRVDPQTLIGLATGVFPDRHHCILSFSHGLASLGNTVYLNAPCSWGPPLITYPPDRAHPIYSFVGFMWGQDLWPKFSSWMNRVVIPTERWNVYQKIAERAFHAPHRPLAWFLD